MNRSEDPANPSPKGAIVLGGAHGSLEIARSLGRRDIPVWLITADNPLASLSRYVKQSLSWPGPNEDGGVAFLIELCHRHGLGGWLLFAGSDDDLRFVAQNYAALSPHFKLTSPAWEKARWTYDKRRMNLRAGELGIAHPLSLDPKSRDDLIGLAIPFPVILKPAYHDGRNAFADAKAWRVDDEETLLSRYDEARSLVGADNIMVQELIPGGGMAQFSYAALWDRGRPIASLVARRRRQYPIDFGFTSTFVETIDMPEIENAAARFLGSLDYSGLVEIEFKFDARDGAYKILDVNARAWTWLALGAAAGIDFPALQWRLACGENVAPMPVRHGVHWIYFSRDLAASIREILSGRLSLAAYLRSLRGSSASAVFAWDDPWPAVFDLPLSAIRVVARRTRRHRAGSVALRSAKLHT